MTFPSTEVLFLAKAAMLSVLVIMNGEDATIESSSPRLILPLRLEFSKRVSPDVPRIALESPQDWRPLLDGLKLKFLEQVDRMDGSKEEEDYVEENSLDDDDVNVGRVDEMADDLAKRIASFGETWYLENLFSQQRRSQTLKRSWNSLVRSLLRAFPPEKVEEEEEAREKVKFLSLDSDGEGEWVEREEEGRHFDAGKKCTLVFIHGFSDDAVKFAEDSGAGSKFINSRCNVVMVDWSALSRGDKNASTELKSGFEFPFIHNLGKEIRPLVRKHWEAPGVKNASSRVFELIYRLLNSYVGPVGAVPAVASVVADFLERNVGGRPAEVNVVGHSLGAHAAGLAGRRFHENTGTKLGKITALDPAGFLIKEASGSLDKLDREDADFVEVIHTNAGPIYWGMFGYAGRLGHADFFVSGGRFQPHCSKVCWLPESIFSCEKQKTRLHLDDECSHYIVKAYLAEVLSGKFEFTARKCTSLTKFKRGYCDSNAEAKMGHWSPSARYEPGAYFLEVNSKPPFARRGPRDFDGDDYDHEGVSFAEEDEVEQEEEEKGVEDKGDDDAASIVSP